MNESMPGVQKFLIVNRLIFVGIFLFAAISISVRSTGQATEVALVDPYTTLDFSTLSQMVKDSGNAEAVANEDDLNVPVAGNVEATESPAEEPKAESAETHPTTTPTTNYYAETTSSTTAETAAPTTTATSASTTYIDNGSTPASYGYYVDDNGVPIDNNYVDNTPRYNLAPEDYTPETPATEDAATSSETTDDTPATNPTED